MHREGVRVWNDIIPTTYYLLHANNFHFLLVGLLVVARNNDNDDDDADEADDGEYFLRIRTLLYNMRNDTHRTLIIATADGEMDAANRVEALLACMCILCVCFCASDIIKRERGFRQADEREQKKEQQKKIYMYIQQHPDFRRLWVYSAYFSRSRLAPYCGIGWFQWRFFI